MYDIKPVVGNCVIILCLLCNVYVENHHVYLLNHIFQKILFLLPHACLLARFFPHFTFAQTFCAAFCYTRASRIFSFFGRNFCAKHISPPSNRFVDTCSAGGHVSRGGCRNSKYVLYFRQ